MRKKLGSNRLEMGRKKRQRKPAAIEEDEEDTSNLPCEVIFLILSKLPVKSLLRFRCVCKPWLSLISEPHFIKTHLNEAIKSDRQRVICSLYKSDCFFDVDYETGGEPEEEVLYFPIKKYRNASVLCSCNGLVLLRPKTDKMYVLWNPSTREYKKFSCPYSEICHNSFHQICYDSSIDDYKVFIIYLGGESGNKCFYFVVYTWKTNSWTEAREFPYKTPYRDGVTVSGVPHWVVTPKKGHNLGYLPQIHGGRVGDNSNSQARNDEPSKVSETSSSKNSRLFDKAMPSYVYDPSISYAIIYFDFVEEKFKEMPLPNWICDDNRFYLTVLRGCLTLYLSKRDCEQVDVCVMKEYGNRDSWSKLITVPCIVGSTILYYSKPMCYTKKGEVVLTDNATVVLYDPKESKVRNMTHLTGMRYPLRAVSYVDSLALPTCVKLTKKQQHKHKESEKMKEL